MEFHEKMKDIQNHILVFLDSEEENEDNYYNLIELLTFQQNQPTIQECKLILNLISRITENHHRCPFFFDKIKKIIIQFKKEIKGLFSNIDIFNIFKNNKPVILLLFDEEILTFDSNILSAIEENKIKDYFYLEINKFHQNNNFISIPEYYDEKRRKGENDSYLCELIRNDDIENFTVYYTRKGFSLSMTIESSNYETNLFLQDKNPTLIEYSAFFGSIQIFRFLFQNQVELTQSLWIYSIHGKNPDIIHFLEENQIYPIDNTYIECLKESIKCHHNDFALYFKDNFINENDIHTLKLAFESNNYDIFDYLLKLPEIEIGLNCFLNCKKLTKFVIPSSITFIGNYAFCGCENLVDITIPSSVTSIGNHSFDGCISLQKITIPDSIKSIGYYAFNKCIGLENITIPSSVTFIGNYSFNYCEKLTKITIPSSVISIGNQSFGNCTSLVEIVIPESIVSLSEFMFSKCVKLIKVSIPSSVTSIGNHSFDGCNSLKQITIPESVTIIGDFAFNGCDKLSNFIIPSSVTSIGNHSFDGCNSLKQITIPNSVTNIGDFAFKDCTKLKSIIIPSSVESIGDCFVSRCYNMKSVIIPIDIKKIGRLDFLNFTSLKEFIIPSCVTIINENAFKNCTSLIKIDIPPSVTSIEYNAFNNCKSLISVTIPPILKSIGFNSFDECISLTKITTSPSTENVTQKIDITVKFPETIKLLTLGDSTVGKTCIVRKYISEDFYITVPTIGVDYMTKSVVFNGNNILLQIYDASGAENFINLTRSYYRGNNGAIIVFDLTNPVTLNRAELLLCEIQKTPTPVPTVLLGNKCDFDHKNIIEDIRQIETKYNTKYFEVSAKDNVNIVDAITYITKEAINYVQFLNKRKILNLINNDMPNQDETKKCIIC